MSIRIASERDIPAMLNIYAPYVEHTTYSFEYEVPTHQQFLQRFSDHVAQFPWLVWEEGEKVLGYAYAGAPWERMAYSWCAEVSIYLADEARGRGIGRQLYQVLEQILTRQGYRMVYALITTENRPSEKFHRAMGYTYRTTFENCGYKMGRWLGVIWYEKQLNPLGAPGALPENWMTCIQNLI